MGMPIGYGVGGDAPERRIGRGMREYLVDVGTLQMSVRDHPGGSPPVLALHGLASNARWWDLVAARLSPRWRVLAPDLRGHGRSDRPEAGYSFAEVVEDLRGLSMRRAWTA